MKGDLKTQTDENLLYTLKLMEEAFEQEPRAMGGTAGSLSQVCEHAHRRLRELLDWKEAHDAAVQRILQ